MGAFMVKIEKDFANLIERNGRFLRTNEDFKVLSRGQHPEYVVVGCSDSRTAPTIVADSKLGDIFEIRLAGGVIDDAALASIEYAVAHLEAKKILIMAHTKCGAVTEAQKMLAAGSAESADEDNALGRLVRSIYDNISSNQENATDLTNAILDNARAQKTALMQSSIIKKAAEEGMVEVAIGLYDIDTGKLNILEIA